ncbi:hypothetical protein [Flavobacterium sp. N1719]|uniref:hypothetical protein n=1 Tax=Flavobacterium sp. N1719 TaxID=2885633 RepID=UPI002221F888|nr:hypothetical protein [Flavobacterium sp. N1719]
MSNIKYFILQHIFPGFYATYANKIIAKNYDKQQNFDVDLSAITAGQEKDYIEQLKADIKEQHDRKKIIEDKAKSLLFIISVSITAITFSLTYLNSLEINIPQTIALILLGVSIVYFVLASIRALQTLNIRKFNVINTAIEITEVNFKLTAKKTDSDFLKELIKSKQQNDLINIQLSNYTYASFTLIRNGIILFVSFFIITIFFSYLSKHDKTIETYQISKEIKIKVNDSIDVKIPYTFELKYDIKNLEIDNQEKK